jgi:hypothetical protein
MKPVKRKVKTDEQRLRAFRERFDTELALENHFAEGLDEVLGLTRELRKLKRALDNNVHLVSPQTRDLVLREALDFLIDHHLAEVRAFTAPKRTETD